MITIESPTIPHPVDIEILKRFTTTERPEFSSVLAVEHYRGDLTQSGDDRMRRAMGEEKYAHFHWDTIACTGGIIVIVPRYKHPEAVEKRRLGLLPAEYHWCFSQIDQDEDCGPAGARVLSRIVSDSKAKLEKELPGLEFIKLVKVNYWHHAGRGPAKRKSQRPPNDVAFFKFTGGVGCVALSNKSETA